MPVGVNAAGAINPLRPPCCGRSPANPPPARSNVGPRHGGCRVAFEPSRPLHSPSTALIRSVVVDTEPFCEISFPLGRQNKVGIGSPLVRKREGVMSFKTLRNLGLV